MVEKTANDGLPVEEVVEEVEQPEGDVVPPELTIDERLALVQLQFEEKREADKRHFQSVTDQQVGVARQQATQANKRAQDLENELRFTRSKEFESLDPDEQRLRSIEMKVAAMGQSQAQANVPVEARIPAAGVALIVDSGIDLDDPRLDLGEQGLTFREGITRLKASIDKIKSDDAAKKEQAIEQTLGEAKERLKSETTPKGNVPVETQGATGRRTKSFEDIEQAWSEGQISPSDYAQARKEAGIE